jgi:hypothetical protein
LALHVQGLAMETCMTHRSHGVSRFALVALAVASLSTAACGPFSSSCSCPGNAGLVVFPSLLKSSPVASVSAGSTCTTTDIGFDRVQIATSTGQTCAFTVQLMDGATYRITVAFRDFDASGCCAGVHIIDGDPAYELVGGGADGGV